jgi:DNA-binding PadR family transcriptional regulator
MKFERHHSFGFHRDGGCHRGMGESPGREGLGRRTFEGGGRRGGRGLEGRGGGRHRMFNNGELRLVLLLLLESEPRHGYDLIREIETRTGGAYSPSPGIVYPTLTYMEELGQVAVASTEGPRKLYSITEPGKTCLAESRTEAEVALARLDQLRRRTEAVDAGPVFRAMNNLKVALNQKLADQPNKELLFAVADAIDEAARKIERL